MARKNWGRSRNISTTSIRFSMQTEVDSMLLFLDALVKRKPATHWGIWSTGNPHIVISTYLPVLIITHHKSMPFS
jgi:hypothetical protein